VPAEVSAVHPLVLDLWDVGHSLPSQDFPLLNRGLMMTSYMQVADSYSVDPP
jgi:hypothetical protein